MTVESPTPKAIRALRTAYGLTQLQAATLVYAARRTWEDWEGGRRPMSPAVWELFGIKVKALP